jgi:phytoene dehydrogenase-like protein
VSDYPLVIIGGGLSGLAAGIRFARFGQKVLILEKHSKPGGLNSYYYRQGRLFETGLHAITNYAPPGHKHAPLNRLLRQLKIPRKQFVARQQLSSEILFQGRKTLRFTNDFSFFQDEVLQNFRQQAERFKNLLDEMDNFEPLIQHPRIPAKKILAEFLNDDLLIDMLLCPAMFYGGSEENDIDFSQFVIMFRSIFQEGLFRPEGNIKDFLDSLVAQLQNFGGELRFKANVAEIVTETGGESNRITGVKLDSGEVIDCSFLLTTIGSLETEKLFPQPSEVPAIPLKKENNSTGRLGFMESIYLLPREKVLELSKGRTIIFYNLADKFNYRQPNDPLDLQSGIICFPENFAGVPPNNIHQLKVTHLANYDLWNNAFQAGMETYRKLKKEWGALSRESVGKIIGKYSENIVYEDSFTPVTIEKYTAKSRGAIYGSPVKVKDGRTNYDNIFLAGTDQGFLGIVGSMFSGVSIVNQHILNKT